ncbi:hypothetical protein ILUMI_08050 [Ignelater luminosus]|uniref:Uncharacterized protein n=1 Tax=Ignelater luminosus TaxID=2038154 RepID=A0A8K0GGA4_IGNLU|nr:hypothetical protein ILUMI_08050 [Ignelater luminosus]
MNIRLLLILDLLLFIQDQLNAKDTANKTLRAVTIFPRDYNKGYTPTSSEPPLFSVRGVRRRTLEEKENKTRKVMEKISTTAVVVLRKGKNKKDEYKEEYEEEEREHDDDYVIKLTTMQPNISNGRKYGLEESTALNALSIRMLLNGTADQLRNISREAIIKSLWAIQKIDLPISKKLIIWDILKDNKPVNTLKRSLFEAAGNLLLSIPESDLFNINVSDWQIVDFFGSLPGLSRRQSGVLGFALKKTHGEHIIQNPESINRIKGLICGFSLRDLSSISEMEFTQIGGEVFDNIGACTPLQKKALLQIAMRVTVYGPPQVWNSGHTEKLGLLISAMDKETLPRIKPQAVEGINPGTLRAMDPNQLRRFTKAQVEYMSDLTLTQYRQKMGLPSDNRQADIQSSILVIFIPILYILDYIV